MRKHNSAVASMEVGDYISGEAAVYKITAVESDSVTVEAAAPYDNTPDEDLEKDVGEVPIGAIDTYGTHIAAEDVESIEVSDGIQVVWSTGTLSGEPAEATISLSDDGSVRIESDGALVPDSYDDVLQLKADIALGFGAIKNDD
jgi:hypothetical protein